MSSGRRKCPACEGPTKITGGGLGWECSECGIEEFGFDRPPRKRRKGGMQRRIVRETYEQTGRR